MTVTKNKEVNEYLEKGYCIIFQDKDYITLEGPKKFSIIIFGFGIIPFFPLGLFYLLYYIGKSKPVITIQKK